MDMYFDNLRRKGIYVTLTMLHPRSRGSISLASADPLDRPLIDPNILGHPEDKDIAMAGKSLENYILALPVMGIRAILLLFHHC